MVGSYMNARLGLAAARGNGKRAHAKHVPIVKRSTCENGGFYISPTKGQTFDVAKPVHLAWDTTMGCLGSNPKQVDIYVNAPGVSDNYLTAIRANYGRGSLDVCPVTYA